MVAGPRPRARTSSDGELGADGVHVARRHARVGQRAERTLEFDRRRVVLGELASLHRVVDADDGDVSEGVGHGRGFWQGFRRAAG